MLLKHKCKETAWHKAAEGHHVELLKKQWDLAKDLQLKSKHLRNEVLLSKDNHKETALQKQQKEATLNF